MPRETKEIVTPSGHKVVMFTYITGRDANLIKEELYKKMKIDLSTGTQTEKEVTGEFLIEQEKKVLSRLVVSVDGKPDNVLEILENMKNPDYQFVVKEANATYTGNFNTEK